MSGNSPAGERLRTAITSVVLGQDQVVDETLIALIAGGHILLEGVPGVAKTTLAKGLACAIGGSFSRIQFTPDLMPSDILGTRIFDPKSHEFEYLAGPIFANCVLCDEINRTPPRTQSAVLELMEERQVTIFGQRYEVPNPFLVIATQNPLEHEGVYPLAEAQVDRFLFKVLVNVPSEADEVRIIQHVLGNTFTVAEPVLDPPALLELQALRSRVYVHPELVHYVVRLSRRVSQSPHVRAPLGPRASISVLRAAQARAVLAGRANVSPHDLLAVLRPAIRHRVHLTPDALCEAIRPDTVVEDAVQAEAPPKSPGQRLPSDVAHRT